MEHPVYNENGSKDNLPLVQAEICEQLYNNGGVSAVTDYANKIGLNYAYCFPCEAEMPIIEYSTFKECACCGTPITS